MSPVRFRALPPLSENAQAPQPKADKAGQRGSTEELATQNEYKFHSFGPEGADQSAGLFLGNSELARKISHIGVVGRPSQSAKITPFHLPGGGLSYRVTVSISGRQRKLETTSLENAQSVQQMWELERVQSFASLRPKIVGPPTV